MHILITGITGFVGGYLAESLLSQGDGMVFGVNRTGKWPANLAHLKDRVQLLAGDLCDAATTKRLLEEIEPQLIFHLAGYAHAGRSLREPDAAWGGNLEATRSLYTAVERWGGRPRIVYAGSGLIYGEGQSAAERFAEDAPLRPANPYAASKAAADLLSYQCTRVPGLDIVRARPFNHIGARQSADYAVPNFARQIAAIERGEQPPILETGNLAARRDLTDVRDVVVAYRLLAERGQAGEAYNIASGLSFSMQTVLERLLARSSARIEVRPRSELLRATDAAITQGDATRLQHLTGWQPRYSLDDTLADILAYWREHQPT